MAGGGGTCEVEAVGMGATRRLLRTPCCEMSARSPSQSHRWLQKRHVPGQRPVAAHCTLQTHWSRSIPLRAADRMQLTCPVGKAKCAQHRVVPVC